VDAFVDDTYLGFTSNDDQLSFEDMAATLQDIAQKWSHLLSLSGGTLNLSKCNWYIMFWEWESGRPRLRRISPTDPTVSITPFGSAEPTAVKRVSLETSSRMLGVHFNPLGDFSEQIKVCKDKADRFALKLLSPRISARDTRIFHR
jgi:hypothetical protein